MDHQWATRARLKCRPITSCCVCPGHRQSQMPSSHCKGRCLHYDDTLKACEQWTWVRLTWTGRIQFGVWQLQWLEKEQMNRNFRRNRGTAQRLKKWVGSRPSRKWKREKSIGLFCGTLSDNRRDIGCWLMKGLWMEMWTSTNDLIMKMNWQGKWESSHLTLIRELITHSEAVSTAAARVQGRRLRHRLMGNTHAHTANWSTNGWEKGRK